MNIQAERIRAIIDKFQDSPDSVTNEDEKNLTRYARQAFSKGEFWSKYKDLYRSPNGYPNWNEVLGARLFCADDNSATLMMKQNDVAGITVGNLCGISLEQGTAVRYISPELCESFQKTPYPELTEEMLDIFPMLMIMIPKGSLITADNAEIEFLIVQSGTLHPGLDDRARRELVKRFGSDRILPKEREGARGIIVGAVSATINYSWIRYVDPRLNTHFRNPELEADVFDSIEAIARVAMNSLLVHLHEPELISVGSTSSIQRGFGRSDQTSRTLPPTWIGKNFKRAQQTQSSGSVPTGRTQRSHWRRGHWHTVLCGKGRQERQMRWFRPVLVNPGA